MAEKKYIDREAFREFWNKEFRHLYPNDKYLVALANFPTADVVEVVHGEWIEENDGTHSCSVCGHDATYTYDGTEVLGLACPYCVSIMDGNGECGEKG